MDINLGLGSWLLIQAALLVIHYGFDKTLPWWVLWFPTLIAGIIGAEANNNIGIAGICWNCKIMPIKVHNSNFYFVLELIENKF